MAKYLKINISLHYKLDISSLSSSDFGIIIWIMDILSRLKFCLVPALSNRNSHLIGYQDLICCILNYSQKDFFFSMHCDNMGAYPRGKKKKKKGSLFQQCSPIPHQQACVSPGVSFPINIQMWSCGSEPVMSDLAETPEKEDKKCVNCPRKPHAVNSLASKLWPFFLVFPFQLQIYLQPLHCKILGWREIKPWLKIFCHQSAVGKKKKKKVDFW